MKRKPQYISSMNMPFEPSGFSFTKVPEREVICRLVPQTSAWNNYEKSGENVNGAGNCANANSISQLHNNPNNKATESQGNENDESERVGHCDKGLSSAASRHLIIINESPFHEGHVLIVPDIDEGLNQVCSSD